MPRVIPSRQGGWLARRRSRARVGWEEALPNRKCLPTSLAIARDPPLAERDGRCAVPPHFGFRIKTYPRALFPDSYFAQAGPSEDASRGVVKRPGSRWPRTGAERTPNARRSEPHGPVATGSQRHVGLSSRIHYYASSWSADCLHQAAAICRCHKNRHEQVPCCVAPPICRLARLVALRYHSSAIIDEDQKSIGATRH